MQKMQDKFFILFSLLLGLGAIYLLAPILTPFITGAILAYLANPLVNQLVRFHLPRILSVTLVFLLIFAGIILLILLLIPLIGKQLDLLMNALPAIIVWIQTMIVPLLQYVGMDVSQINLDTVKSVVVANWAKAGGAADWLFQTMLVSGVRVIEWVLNLILVPVVTFYLLCDWNKFLSGICRLLPRRIEPIIVKRSKECDEVLHAFFRGQLWVMIVLGVIYSIGLTLVGLHTGLLIGVIAGLFCIVPYLGSIVGIVLASIVAFMQLGSFTAVLLVWVVFAIGHLIDNFFLTPRLVGHRIGLHPVAVIFAILAGGELFGFLGVLLALPAAASVMVWARYLNRQYQKSELYKA